MEYINNSLIKKLVFLLIWGSFGVYLLLQFINVQIYYDDFGYYSLAYGVITSKGGHSFTLLELMSFLGNHYMKVNGRLFYFFIWLASFMFGGLKLVQIFAAAGVFCLFLLSWLIIQEGNKDKKVSSIWSSVCICLCYGLLEIWILNYGTYWMAAYFQYVFALVPFLGFALLYFKKRKVLKESSVFTKILLTLLVIATGWSQESWAVATVGFMVMLIIYEIFEKRISFIHFIFLIVSIICLLLLIRCPGILLRAETQEKFYSLSFIGKITKKTPEVLADFFNMRLFQLGLSFSQIFIGVYLLFKENSIKWKIFDIGYAICFVLVDVVYFKLYYSYQYLFSEQGRINLKLITIEVILLTLILVQVTRYYLKQAKICQLLIFYTTVLSIACLVVVPQIPLRLYLPITLLSSILITDAISTTISLIKIHKITSIIFIISLLIFAKLTVPNMLRIYEGYYKNAIVWTENDKKMKDASQRIANGEDVTSVKMTKLPLKDYAGEMLYSGVADYMKYWMCDYYNLPQDIELDFEDYDNTKQ